MIISASSESRRALVAQHLRGLDERASHVAVLHEPVRVRDAALRGESLSCRYTRLGDRHDHVGFDGVLLGEDASHLMTRGMDAPPVHLAVGASEVHEFEDAELGVDGGGLERSQAVGAVVVDDHRDRRRGRRALGDGVLLDSASLRRFNHKIGFDYLTAKGNLLFYDLFLKPLSPEKLDQVSRTGLKRIKSLAPGDFKVVRDRFSFHPPSDISHMQLIDALRNEAKIKNNHRQIKRIGFN